MWHRVAWLVTGCLLVVWSLVAWLAPAIWLVWALGGALLLAPGVGLSTLILVINRQRPAPAMA